MFRILLLLFIAIPLIEFTLLYYLSLYTSWATTVVIVLLTGFVGAWLAKAEGYRTWRNMQSELSQGKTPSDTLMDALMIFIAGLLLVTPGILTDLLGFSLLIKPCRTFYKQLAGRYIRARFKLQGMPFPPSGHDSRPQSSQIIDSYVVEHSDDDQASGGR